MISTTLRLLSTALEPQSPAVVTTINTGFQGPKGDQGPPGSPGAGGASVETLKNASGAVGGLRAVYAVDLNTVAHASASVLLQAQTVIGVSKGAAVSGDPVQVVQLGEIVDPSWSWSDGPVYLGENGLLTQTPPASGQHLQIGVATAPTNLYVKLGDVITL